MKKLKSLFIITILTLFSSIKALGQEYQFEPIAVDRIDGFYATVNYNSNTSDGELELTATPDLTVQHIKKVQKIISPYTSKPEIAIRFTKKGSEIFQRLSKENIGKPIAIVLDQKIVYLPIVQSEITGGRVVINGNFTLQEIDDMARRLKEK